MDKYLNSEYFKIFFSLLFFGLIVYPFISDSWSKIGKQITHDMKGENNKWDWNEIWERYSLRSAKVFLICIVFMILMKTLYNTDYSWELYLLVFAGTLGSNGVGAFLIYMKTKKS